MGRRTVLCIAGFVCIFMTNGCNQDENITGFEVAEGLSLSLFAEAPMLTNPTNMDIDERGRVWVCEAVNYRPGYNPHHRQQEEGDRILILEDTDGDGVADSRKVFYQGTDINAALGILVLGSKIIVSSSPHVLVFTDEDGDDHPDRKEMLFTGIGGEQDDHGVHAFVFGPDGRLYFNFGNAGRQLMDRNGMPVVDRAGNAVNNSGNPYREGMVFRMHLDGTNLEVLGHNFRNNYEVATDAYGTLWQSDNDDDGNRAVRINYVMEYGNYGYRDEKTGAHWSVPRTGMHANIPLRHWHLNDPGVVPNLLQTGAGSPTGILVYEGRLLPRTFWDQIIHADAGPGIVRAYPVTEDGAGYKAGIVNILSNEDDQWFRPSDVAVAPDGSLFIADWYDATVGGNQAVDQEQGHIFRVAPPGTPYTALSYDFSDRHDAVEALMSPNMATHARAFLALQAMGKDAESVLAARWQDATDARHRARVLWLLGKIDPRYAEQALGEDDPQLRIVGLRLARQTGLPVLPLVERVVTDPSPQVRREAALALRHEEGTSAARLWATLATQHEGTDRWYLEALGISADGQWDRFFAAWMAMVGEDWKTPGGRDIVWRARTRVALEMLAEMIRDEQTTTEERERYFRAFDFHDDPHKYILFASVVEGASIEVIHGALLHLVDPSAAQRPEITAAVEQVLDAMPGTESFLWLVDRFGVTSHNDMLREMAFHAAEEKLASQATRLLLQMEGAAPFREALRQKDAGNLLGRIAIADTPVALQLLEEVLLDTTRTLPLRRMAVDALGRTGSGQSHVLALLRQERFPEILRSNAASFLLNAWSLTLRAEAEELLGMPSDRNAEALPPIRSLVSSVGNPEKGEGVFTAHCQRCHNAGAEGTVFGPSLSEIGSKLSKHALFVAILHPDAGISHGFAGERVILTDNSQIIGYVESDNPDELSLRVASGEKRQVSTADIVSRTALRQSLMPALQGVMTRQELVDLVAYLHDLKTTQ